ncbi:MAG: glycosyltransferase [Candidatus Limisoma sp.]
MKSLSIIIPMYKVEDYIAECLQSILRQDCRNIGFDYELILVDDGSPDNCVKVAQSILSRLPYKLIRQSNSGQGAARNAALEVATGEFVWFVDADDWISDDSFAALADVDTTDLDAIAINAIEEVEGAKCRLNYGNNVGGVVSGLRMLEEDRFSYCPYLTIYRRAFLNKNSLRFCPGVYHEDNEFTPRAYYYARRIYQLDRVLYHVRINMQSTTRCANPKRYFDLFTVASRLSEFSDSAVEKRYRYLFSRCIGLALNSALDGTIKYEAYVKAELQKRFLAEKSLWKHFLKSKKTKYIIEGIVFMVFGRFGFRIYEMIKR